MAPGEFWVPLEPDGPGEQRSVVVLPSPRIAAPLIPIDWEMLASARGEKSHAGGWVHY